LSREEFDFIHGDADEQTAETGMVTVSWLRLFWLPKRFIARGMDASKARKLAMFLIARAAGVLPKHYTEPEKCRGRLWHSLCDLWNRHKIAIVIEPQKTNSRPMKSGPSPAYKWELLALFWLANFLNQGDRQIFNAILPRIQSGLGATDVEMGRVAAIFTLCFGVLVPVAGWLADRASRKHIVSLSLLVFSIGTLLTGFSGGILSLIIFRSIATGAGESFYTPPALSLIGEHHIRTRSRALSINQTAQYVGIIASSWIAAWLAETFGWRTAFYAFGGAGLLLAGVLFLRLRNDPPPQTLSRPVETGVPVDSPARKPSVYLLTVAFSCMVFATTGFMTWMPTLLYTKFELSLTTAAFQAVFIHYVFAFAGVLFGGWLSDKLARTGPVARFHTAAAGLILGTPFIFLLGYSGTLQVVYIALAAFGFFRGIYDANLFATLYEVVPVRKRATATGIMICFAYVTGAAAPLLLGYLKQYARLDHGLAWLAPAYLLGGVLIEVAALWFFHRDHVAETSS